jgi:hypothetical protein
MRCLYVAVDVTQIFKDFLAGNRGPDPNDYEHRRRPNYAVVATLIDGLLEVELTFRFDSAYCCMESGCHLGLFDGKRWNGLRRRLMAYGIAPPRQMELRLTCVIEEGALFFDFAKPDQVRRGWYAFYQAAAHRYQAKAIEAPSPMEPGAGHSLE